jgi:hypothetical protein
MAFGPPALRTACQAHILSSMWQEYTRETPARPFLAVLGTGLALAAATGLAWLVTDARAIPTTEVVQSPPDWPIAFKLPLGVSWVRRGDSSRGDMSWDGAQGAISYAGKGSDQLGSALIVAFGVLPEGTSAEEALFRLTGHRARAAEETTVGPLTGTMAASRSGTGALNLAAAACSERGLAFAVEYVTLEHGSRARLAFQEVCRSIKYKDWSIKHRTDEFFLPD